MRTVKIEGSGMLAGFTAYGNVRCMDLTGDGVVLDLDQEYYFDDKLFSSVTLSADSGALLAWYNGPIQTDLIHVVSDDLPRLQEMHTNWYGK